jgi:sigma-B regulation protein RsbU (phosphoserine phosphatase)
MTDLSSTLASILLLLGNAALMIVVAFIFININFSKSTARKSLIIKLILGIVMGVLAIYGTIMGTKLSDGTIVNVRELAPMIAGVAGGPIAGTLAGIIGGAQRYTLGGATALPCTVSTILIGVISGFAGKRLFGKMYLLKGAALGFVLESFAQGLILAMVQPFGVAANIVSQIAIPMITSNTVGLFLWMYFFNKRSTRAQQNGVPGGV